MKYSTLLENYKSGVSLLKSILADLSGSDLDYRPDRVDAWTIKEHVIHLADSEVNGFIRCKSILAQPGSECFVMEEETWTKNLRRKEEDVQKYIRLFELIRSILFDLLSDEPEENWTKDFFTRRYNGETSQVNLEKCLGIYVNHLTNHLVYIEKIIEELRQ